MLAAVVTHFVRVVVQELPAVMLWFAQSTKAAMTVIAMNAVPAMLLVMAPERDTSAGMVICVLVLKPVMMVIRTLAAHVMPVVLDPATGRFVEIIRFVPN